jgi:hypothetical protein
MTFASDCNSLCWLEFYARLSVWCKILIIFGASPKLILPYEIGEVAKFTETVGARFSHATVKLRALRA